MGSQRRQLAVVRSIVAGAVATFAAAHLIVACTPTVPFTTYHDDVAPLFAAQCVGCHQAGGIGPFPLATYADVVAHKDEVVFSIQTRRMPPFTLDNSGACQTFRDARWLSDAEIALVTSWVADGAAEGDRKSVV